MNFQEASRPLIQYLAENHHPHHTVIVTCNSAELLEGKESMRDDSFLKD